MALLLVVVLATGVCAVTMDSELVGGAAPLPNPGTTIPLHAEAVWDGNYWSYTYVATITNASRNVTGFSVQNIPLLPYFGAWNDKNCVNPPDGNLDSVFWSGGSVPPSAGTITFGFRSAYGPTVVDVSLFGGARTADGKSLGMAIPEPASVAAMSALAFGGIAAIYRRRRSRR